MKYCILFPALLLTLFTEAQNPDLIFNGSINSITLRKTTHREIEQLFGEPDSLRFSYSNANIGSCIPFRHSFLEYTKRGLSFNCSSYGNKKTSKKKKWVRNVEFNEKSGIVINESVICGKSKKEEIIALFPDYQIVESDKSLYCESKWNGKNVFLYFIFDDADVLQKVKIE